MEVKPIGSKILNSQNETTTRSVGSTLRQVFFGETLKNVETDNKKQICSELLGRIDAQSEELKKAATPEGVKRYRKLVSVFMKEALSQSYDLNEESRWDRSGNRKSFITVKKINQAMEDLMDSMVQQEKKQIDLVAKLDEIRGLLLDLYI